MLMKLMEILVSQGRSQGAGEHESSPAWSFDLACPGVARPPSVNDTDGKCRSASPLVGSSVKTSHDSGTWL